MVILLPHISELIIRPHEKLKAGQPMDRRAWQATVHEVMKESDRT